MSGWVTILYSSDLHSHFDNWSRMETIAKRLMVERGRQNIVRLDAGDHSDRSAVLTEGSRGRANIELLAAARTDAFVCGDTEVLSWPAAHLFALADRAPFSILAADLALNDGTRPTGLVDRAVVHRAGLKIGLFGLSRSTADGLETLGLRHRSPAEAAAETARELRLDGCDLVICLSHLGIDEDRVLAESEQSIDVIVGGHSHSPLPHGEQVGATILVHAGANGHHLGRLDLKVKHRRVESWETGLLPTQHEKPDPETQELLQRLDAQCRSELAEVLAYLPSPLPPGAGLPVELPAGPVTRGDLLRASTSISLRDKLADGLTGRLFWPGEPVRVESCTLDGKLRKYVDATVVSAGPDEVVLRAGPGYVIKDPDGEPLLTIPHAVDYHFWPGRQYNLFRLFDTQGAWVGDYYNVAMPFAARPGVLSYSDLELDVYFPAADEPPQLLDEDELAEAPYPPELKNRIRQVAESLLVLGTTEHRPGGPIWPRPVPQGA